GCAPSGEWNTSVRFRCITAGEMGSRGGRTKLARKIDAVKPARRPSLRARQEEIDPEFLAIDGRHLNADPVAELEATAPVLADQRVLLLDEYVVVVFESTHVYEPLHEEVIQENEQTVGGYTADRSRELVAEVAFHELDLLQLDAVALGLDRDSLPLAGQPGDRGKRFLSERLGQVLSIDERAGHETVHDQVRVAPDRRGEVGVVPGRESEVPQVLMAVTCLAHGAQNDGGDDVLLGATLYPGKKALEILWRRLRPSPEAVPEGRDELPKLLDSVGVRRLVDAIDERHPGTRSVPGDRLVRQEHEVLDQAVTLQPQHALDVGRLALGVQDHPGFREVEIEAASGLAPG